MIAEKTNTAQLIIEAISATAGKVNFIGDETLSKALLLLENKGIPTNKHEDYKYCNLDAVFKKEFKNIEQKFNPIVSADAFKFPKMHTLVVLNGEYSVDLSGKDFEKGLDVQGFGSLGEEGRNLLASIANVESDAFVALNTAFSGKGFYLRVEKNMVLQTPIQILYITNSDKQVLVNPRNIIEIGENAEAIIIEQQISLGSGKKFSNFLSEKIVRENGKLSSYTIQDEGENGYSVNTNQVKVLRDGKYANTTVTLSGAVVRNNHNVVLGGKNGEAWLNGLFVTGGQQLVDNHTLMDHQVPNCESSELYKGIINDKSTGVFNGKIFVRKDAQKTNAYQSSKNILLSDDGTINTKPQLEIYADDVKCSHGTSTGKIDEAAMFYLNARGISKETAKRMLLNAFAGEVIDKMEIEALREHVEEKLGFS
jgi:Fe-S cluster assembly protein SufD